ncbi:polysaccharide biosynthesis protein [Glaesserella parasuis]|uniref:polysaccharide biosynthesis protein n=1 Tax=Glaesserella parasuis TaxID=738 RepID=UPI0007A098BD|nr:nucleoside-diphosphate sugar epimerase/dehydratase [Glaesserella parasuis]AMW16041.1 capsular biosynthesis protein [Glaesserella parasuis]MDG6271200.1 nucleoside-diphosphate sugar epimerase/dehydratase [Glaesserella parasuis]MDG6306820.1 nucleoside-diphosphate sugar epimerase/dehydratase [Glaesserella parasuis]MDG6343110.1 nucleoside-diphosphate sugar epimerase/dehydratase [Glaesserella parasuis]MDG6485873.1 nucleoside-diphosphate sugar epimerase/dehydratase [Glaesserella parasuis]
MFQELLTHLTFLPRNIKQIGLVLFDFTIFPILIWGVYALRLFDLNAEVIPNLPYGEILVSIIAVASLAICGVYHFVIHTFSETLIFRLSIATLITVIALFLLGDSTPAVIPTSIPLMFGFFMFAWVYLSRGVIRALVKNALQADTPRKRIAIYGTGSAGQQLAVLLLRSHEHLPIFFIDDNENLVNTRLGRLKVFSAQNALEKFQRYQIDQVIIALSSVERARKNEIVKFLSDAKVKIMEIPELTQIVDGKVSISDIKEINIIDLLGREPVAPIPELFSKNIQQQIVMVTGAGGSIGSELCRQIIRNQPRKLLLFEISEYGLYAIERELNDIVKTQQLGHIEIIPLLGSVQNFKRLVEIMRVYQVDTVYHAAAYKHVPMVEYNVVEGVRNNIFGTYYTAQAAIEAQVNSFVLISTDKAVRPTNVMGATKRSAELCLQALAMEKRNSLDGVEHNTLFSMVRFGNVLGSSGSVIPLFKEQIRQGGPITVTDPNIIRYFMTIPEAAQLVIQAGAMAKGGDVFILDMGEPVKIVDLAVNLIRLSGLEVKNQDNPTGDIEIKFTGIRSGEKLYEELLIAGDNVETTAHHRIMTAKEDFLPLNELLALLEELELACQDNQCDKIRDILLNSLIGYTPVSKIVDFVWRMQVDK